jgi:CRISPR type III-associated protein (TIGR04423 family)
MKNYIKKEIKKISEIPDYKFMGYYWMSHKDKPDMLFEKNFPKEMILQSINPFCVEALLYSSEKNISIHIQHTGVYMVTAFDHDLLKDLEVITKEYIPHKLEQVEKVLFKQVWEEESSQVESEPNFPTLKPSALIFSGFKF